MPLSEVFWTRLGLLETARFIVSHPRSGSRWLMMALSLMAGRRLGCTMPELYRPAGERAAQPWVDALRGAVVINAHDHPYAYRAVHGDLIGSSIYRSHDFQGVMERTGHPVLYLYREAPAAMFSYWQYSRQLSGYPYKGSLEQFCDERLDDWINHLQSALDWHVRSQARIKLLPYGQNGPLDADGLALAVRFLGLGFLPEECSWGAQRLRQVIDQLNARSDASRSRGGHRDLAGCFPAGLLTRIQQRTQALIERADQAARLDALDDGRPG